MQRTSWLHSCCCTAFAKRPGIQSRHRYQVVPAVCQASCPLWQFEKYWIQWPRWRAAKMNVLSSMNGKNAWITWGIFLPLWWQYPECSRCFWSMRTCVYVAQGSPPRHNRGWINRRTSHSPGWRNPTCRYIESVWPSVSGRKEWHLRSLGIQPPVWEKQIKLWSMDGWEQLEGAVWVSIPNDAEHVDVGVVGGEVDEDHSSPSVQPQVVHQVLQYDGALLSGPTQVLIVSCAAVCCQQAPVGGTFDLFLRVIAPTLEEGDRFVEFVRYLGSQMIRIWVGCLDQHHKVSDFNDPRNPFGQYLITWEWHSTITWSFSLIA